MPLVVVGCRRRFRSNRNRSRTTLAKRQSQWQQEERFIESPPPTNRQLGGPTPESFDRRCRPPCAAESDPSHICPSPSRLAGQDEWIGECALTQCKVVATPVVAIGPESAAGKGEGAMRPAANENVHRVHWARLDVRNPSPLGWQHPVPHHCLLLTHFHLFSSKCFSHLQSTLVHIQPSPFFAATATGVPRVAQRHTRPHARTHRCDIDDSAPPDCTDESHECR